MTPVKSISDISSLLTFSTKLLALVFVFVSIVVVFVVIVVVVVVDVALDVDIVVALCFLVCSRVGVTS